jgi:hypothetical protein
LQIKYPPFQPQVLVPKQFALQLAKSEIQKPTLPYGVQGFGLGAGWPEMFTLHDITNDAKAVLLLMPAAMINVVNAISKNNSVLFPTFRYFNIFSIFLT